MKVLQQQILLGFILLFIYAGPINLFAQQYNIRNYSALEIGQSRIHVLLEDHKSYIWIGTEIAGLIRFNGLEFEHFTSEDGLPSDGIKALHEDDQRQLWIGTEEGLCRYDGQHFIPVAFASSEKIPVNTITHTPSGELWVGTSKGLYQLQKDSLLHLFQLDSIPINTPINSCLADRQGLLWIGSDQGVMRIGRFGAQFFDDRDGLVHPNVTSLLEDRNGNMLMGTNRGDIYEYNSTDLSIGRFEGSNEIEEKGEERINSILEDKEGNLWVATKKSGAYVQNAKDSTSLFISAKEGLVGDYITDMIEDRWGNIWLSTDGGQLSCYIGNQFLSYELPYGVVNSEVYALNRDRSNQLWLGTNKGLSLLDSNSLTYHRMDTAFSKTEIKTTAIYQDYSGQLWVGTEKGLAIRDSNAYNWFYEWNSGLCSNQIEDILQDTAKHIWIATNDAGICEVIPNPKDTTGSGYLFIHHGEEEGIKDQQINQLLIDQQFRLWWAGDRYGIGYIADDSIHTFGVAEGLEDLSVNTLVEDRYGNLWGGTKRKGVFRMDIYSEQPAIQYFGKREGLTSNEINLLVFDETGYLWAGNGEGVDRIRLDGEQNIVEVNSFDSQKGFKGRITGTRAVIGDEKGGLWFGTTNGLMRYLPGGDPQNAQAPILNFTNINLFYESLAETEYANWVIPGGGLRPGLQLPYDQNHLSFDFIGINHSNPEQVNYQWMMKGAETSWPPRSKQKHTTYSNLSPGSYTFQLRAYNEDEVMSGPISLSFEILPPFWATWWFRLAALAAAGLLISLIVRARVNRIKRKARVEREKLELEKNLLQLEQKALQLQMNPHFIFNALNSIQGLIGQQDHRKARYQLAKFSRLMRAILENSRTTLIPLEQEIETLNDYLSLEQFSRAHSFKFDIKADGLEPEVIGLPPMMIQPFVENAIIHGLGRVEEGGAIDIRFARRNGLLECTVVDNGIGREKARQLKSQQEQQHKSMALQVTQERLDLLGTKAGKSKSLEILDMKDKGVIKGTKVIVRLPYTEL